MTDPVDFPQLGNLRPATASRNIVHMATGKRERTPGDRDWPAATSQHERDLAMAIEKGTAPADSSKQGDFERGDIVRYVVRAKPGRQQMLPYGTLGEVTGWSGNIDPAKAKVHVEFVGHGGWWCSPTSVEKVGKL